MLPSAVLRNTLRGEPLEQDNNGKLAKKAGPIYRYHTGAHMCATCSEAISTSDACEEWGTRHKTSGAPESGRGQLSRRAMALSPDAG